MRAYTCMSLRVSRDTRFQGSDEDKVSAGRDRVKSRACGVNASERMHFAEIR